VYFDVIGRLELRVLPRIDALDVGEDASAPRWREPARRIEALLESPDRAQDLRSWLIAFVRDLLDLDAVAVYTRRTRGGDLYALELVDGACYTRDMEVLTKSGWKRFQDVDIETDSFATRNTATKAFEWQKATYFHQMDWNSAQQGDLYHFTSRSLDLRVSPNHRMLVSSLPRSLGGSRHREQGEVIMTAEQLAKAVEGRRDSGYTTIPATTPRSSSMVFSGDDFAAFMGMWLAEGTASNGDQIYISQRPTSKDFDAYEELVERIWGRSVCHTGAAFVIGHKALHDYLRQFGHAHEKFIPEVIREMSRRQLAIFWHYYVLGDGHYSRSKSGAVHEKVITVSKEFADYLQEILQKMGYSASIQVRYPTSDKTLSNGRVIKVENQRVAYILTKRTSTH
jgi:LAGLIDADG-like domain